MDDKTDGKRWNFVAQTAASVVVLLAALPALAHADARYLTGHAFEKSYIVSFSSDDLKKTPAWDPSADNPPLSARKALKLAIDYRKTLIPGHADLEWHLEYLGLCQTGGRWYWLAHFEGFPKNGPGTLHDLYVVVLMDGTIVKPRIEDTVWPNSRMRGIR